MSEEFSAAGGCLAVTLSDSEGSLDAVLSISEGFFAEFTLSEILRSLRFLRMTRSEGLRMSGRIAKQSGSWEFDHLDKAVIKSTLDLSKGGS